MSENTRVPTEKVHVYEGLGGGGDPGTQDFEKYKQTQHHCMKI